MVKERICFAFGLLFLAFMSWSQQPYIELQVEPLTVEVGQNFTIVLRTNAEGSLDFEMPDEFNQSGIAHSGMSSSINYINNKAQVEKYSFQKFVGYINEPGRYKIGPAKLKTNNGELVSKEIIIQVVKPLNMISEDPARNMNEPVFGIIQQSSKTIFEGEPLIVEAKVYSQVDVLQIDRFQNFEFKGPHDAHLLHTSKEVEKEMETIKGRPILTFKAGKTLLFPERTGTFELSPFQMTLYCSDAVSLFPTRVNIKSNESKVIVKPLPGNAPAEFIGAVGRFEPSASVSQKKIKIGDVLEYKVTIEGTGNLHNIDIPKLTLPKGAVLYGDPEEKNEISFTLRGAEGKKEITYYIQINQRDVIELPMLTIAYFDPETEKYISKSTKAFTIEVFGDKNIALDDSNPANEDEEENVLFLDPMLNASSLSIPSMSGGALALSVGLPPLLALLFGFFVKYRADNREELTTKSIKKTALSRAKERIDALSNTPASPDFSSEVSQVLFNYLSEKFSCSSAEISRSWMSDVLNNNSELSALLIFLDELDLIRFGGGITSIEKQSVMLAELDRILSELDRQIS